MPDLTRPDLVKTVIHRGLRANNLMRKSMENLSAATLTANQVVDIFQSQAELHKVHLAWNSFTSLSLVTTQHKIERLENKVKEQDKIIRKLGYNLSLHQMAIQKLYNALYLLAMKFKTMKDGQHATLQMLKILQTQMALTLSSHVVFDLGTQVASLIRTASCVAFKYGLLAIISDSIISLSKLMSLLKIILVFIPHSKTATKLLIGARISLVLSLMVLLRKKWEKLLKFLAYFLKSL